MPKSVSTALKAHLASPVTSLASCWQVTRRDGTVFYLTDHDQDLVVDGHTYLASAGYQRTAMAANADLSVDNLELTGMFDNAVLSESDLRSGAFDFADIRVLVVNWADLSQGVLKLRRGYLGEVSSRPSGIFTAELRGMTQRLVQKIGQIYSPDCRADLGDTRCKVPIAPDLIQRNRAYAAGDHVRVVTDGSNTDSRRFQDRIYRCTGDGSTAAVQPAYDTTPGNATVDGAATFVCLEAWTRSGAAGTVTDSGSFFVTLDTVESRAVDDWFTYGVLTWESGGNAGRSMEVKAWTAATTALQLFLPMDQPVLTGDRLRLYPGCNKLVPHCRDKFANILNMRAEPFVPGTDQTLALPNQA
jgi:hypothetical protein